MSSGNEANASNTPNTPPPGIQRPASSGMGMWAAVAVVIVIVLIVLVAWQGGWLSPKTNNSGTNACTPPAEKLVGAGSTLVFPLMYFWETTWQTKASGSSVNYQSVGSTAGITAITGHTVDFGASDAPLNPAQRAAAHGLMMIPESAGAVVPIYNVAGLTSPLKFSGATLAGIYAQNITTWDDPAIVADNPGVTLPSNAIIPVHRAEGSGTTFIFSSFLAASSPYWAAHYGHATTIVWPSSEVAQSGNSGIASTVKSTPNSIGYVDIAFALANTIAYGAVKNPTGNYVLANVTNTASALNDSTAALPAPTADWYNFSIQNAPGANDYPISSLTYVLVYQDPGTAFAGLYTTEKAQNLVSWLKWIVGPGQQYSSQLFYVPLPAAIVTYDQTAINSITYNGAAVSVCVPS
jgi:phosphate ABC transporter phosphate-binding protein